MRAMARAADGRTSAGRAQGGRRRLSAVRRSRRSIRRSRSPRCSPQRDGAFGAAADPALLARLDLEPGARITRRPGDHRDPRRRSHRSPTSSPAASASVRACSSAKRRLRATGLLQPGSLVRWHYRLRLPDNDATDPPCTRVTAAAQAQLPEAGWDVRTRANASPAARAQCRALHPIPHAGRPDRAAGRRRRRRQCGQEPSRPQARRHRHAEIARRHRRRACSPSISPRSWCWPRSARCPGSRSAPRCRS